MEKSITDCSRSGNPTADLLTVLHLYATGEATGPALAKNALLAWDHHIDQLAQSVLDGHANLEEALQTGRLAPQQKG
jgi:hypothetical protein